jgi:Putative Ig domain/Secretion system C-terminal sorting domain/Beta-galactosidase
MAISKKTIFVIVNILLIFNLLSVAKPLEDDRQRYVGLQLLNLDGTVGFALPHIRTAVANGCNLVHLTLYWDRVYPTPNATPDWRQPDQEIELATQLGAKVAIRIMLGRNANSINGFWTDKERPQDANFAPMTGIYNTTSFSFNHQPAVDKANDFVKQVCQRYSNLQNQGKILFISFVTTPAQELAYHFENWPEGKYEKRYGASYDYSKSSTNAFNDFMAQKYVRISKLNSVWKSANPAMSWYDASPEPTPWEPKASFSNRRGHDWYYFHHQSLKKFIDQTISTIKGVNASFKVVNEYGSVIDNLSAIRGTLAFKDLDQNADGTKVNDDLKENHRLTTDIIRSNQPGKWILNEVFYDNVSPLSEYARQFDECFEAGCKVVVFVLSTDGQVEGAKSVIRNMANKWLNVPVPDITPQVSMKYSVLQVIDSTKNSFIYKEYTQKAGSTNPRPVNVQLVEDILQPDYWNVLINVPPVVNYVIEDKISRPRRDFVYKLPSDLFKDPDGNIINIEAIDLPSWLVFKNEQFSGIVPSPLVEYVLKVRASDDDGASIQTSFKLKVVDSNVLPVVNYVVNDRTTKPRKNFSFKIPSDLFKDPDGNIAKVEAINLPSWLKFENNELSGIVPDALVDYAITLRATDDDGATVQTNFKIKVTDINIKPVVSSTPLPNIDGYWHETLVFRIPDEQFSDPDGRIVRVEGRNFKSWMSLKNNTQFEAYPEEFGNFKITLRAIDDDSAWVESSFVLHIINRPPTVVHNFADKIIAIDKPFKYKVSKDNFADYDGGIARVNVFNRPSWMTFANEQLTGTPPQLGAYRLVVRAYDIAGDSVETTLNIIVDSRQNLNVPPVVNQKIADVQMLVGQKFNFKITDSLFYDTNGYIDRVETPNLPSWLTFKNNEITGTASQIGSFTITLKAIDDDETFVTTSFQITVRFPKIWVEMQQAGSLISRRLIGQINDGDVVSANGLPEKINFYAYCEQPVTAMNLNLSGPYRKFTLANRFPYTLLDENVGFSPVIGTYSLEIKAISDSIVISQKTIHFKFTTDKPLADWQTYPNPFEAVCNLKIPDNLVPENLNYRLINVNGQEFNIQKNAIESSEKVVYLNLSSLQLPVGIYFVKIYQGDELLKIVKVVKQ